MKYILIKSLNQLEENYFIDNNGDAWENEKIYKKWSENSFSQEYECYLASEEIGLFLDADRYPLLSQEEYKWCIKEYITKETHPEYFL